MSVNRSGGGAFAHGFPREGGGLCRLPPGKTHREQSVQPKDDGRSPSKRRKRPGFAPMLVKKPADNDRGKPQPMTRKSLASLSRIRQITTTTAAIVNRHGVLPWYFRPVRRSRSSWLLMIGRNEGACRLIRCGIARQDGSAARSKRRRRDGGESRFTRRPSAISKKELPPLTQSAE